MSAGVMPFQSPLHLSILSWILCCPVILAQKDNAQLIRRHVQREGQEPIAPHVDARGVLVKDDEEKEFTHMINISALPREEYLKLRARMRALVKANKEAEQRMLLRQEPGDVSDGIFYPPYDMEPYTTTLDPELDYKGDYEKENYLTPGACDKCMECWGASCTCGMWQKFVPGWSKPNPKIGYDLPMGPAGNDPVCRICKPIWPAGFYIEKPAYCAQMYGACKCDATRNWCDGTWVEQPEHSDKWFCDKSAKYVDSTQTTTTQRVARKSQAQQLAAAAKGFAGGFR